MDKKGRLRQGLPSLILIWAMLIIASMAVLQADLIDGLYVLPIVATLALVFGWLLARSMFSDRTAHTFALVYGLFFIFYLVGTTLPYEGPWRERVLDLLTRQVDWLQKAFSGGTSRDGIIFVIQTTAVFWILGHLSAWYTFRRPHVWRVVIPTGIVLLSVVYYYNGPRPLLIYLAIYTLLALIFVAVTHLTAEENGWQRNSIRYDRSIQFDFMRAGLVASLLALLLAWSLPTLHASSSVGEVFLEAGGPWRSFQDTWTRLFSSLRSYGAGSTDPYQDTLVLGGPRSVGNNLIMDVQVGKELPYGVYWQAITYDTYLNGGWNAAETEVDELVHYPEDGPLDVPLSQSRTVITQTVTNYLPNSSFIYAAPEVMSTDRPILIDTTFDPEGQMVITALRSRFLLRQGDQYEVTSRVSVANATELRGAATEYPQWIIDRFLQLPETISPETISLAEELTTGINNPYDKAIAVRDYLRRTIEYNDQIAAPPEGVEPVHYVLFDSKEAYCTYYASAMAVMLRSQGIPARLVSGYALGEYNELALSYRVRAVNAHTWVEVFFPEYGWIHFEPTRSIPVAERPSGGTGAPSDIVNEQEPILADFMLPEENDLERGSDVLPDDAQNSEIGDDVIGGLSWFQIGIGIVLLALAGGTLYGGAAYNRRIEGDIDRSYLRLGDWSRWLGIPWRANQTPYEQADSLVAVVPEGQKPVRSLTRQYVIQRFSPNKAKDEDFDPHLEWRELRPMLIKRRIIKALERSRKEE